jgi:hypothetical protein
MVGVVSARASHLSPSLFLALRAALGLEEALIWLSEADAYATEVGVQAVRVQKFTLSCVKYLRTIQIVWDNGKIARQ